MKLWCRGGSFKMESPHLGTVIHHLSKTHKIFFPQHIQRVFFPSLYVEFLQFTRLTFVFFHSFAALRQQAVRV